MIKLSYKTVKVEDLKPGDLFVNASPEKMDMMLENEMGISVFLKTNAPITEKTPAEGFAPVQVITIKKK